MFTTLTTIAPDTPAGRAIGPNRYPPQPEAPPPSDRFATLLQQRQQSQPPAKTSPANAESKAAPKTPSPQDDVGNEQGGGNAPTEGAADGTSAATSMLQASAGCGARTWPARLPPESPREKPIAEAPPVDPAIGASDSAASPDAYCELPVDLGKHGASDDGVDTDDVAATPEAPIAAPPFMPGLSGGPGLSPATTAADALGATGGGGPDARTASGAGATLASVAVGRGAAGDASAGGRGRGDTDDDAEDGHAASRLSEAIARADKALTSPADRFVPPQRVPPTIEASSGIVGHAGGIAPRGAEASATTPVTLPTPLHAPDFAKALGAQVSLFARNGLAQAELQLTPADMGPIRVQIAIEGAHARIDFAADAAATRQVIERGLPELASALREQGLTLSGGGVFQHAPDQRGEAETPSAQAARATRGARQVTSETTTADSIAPAARARTIAAQRGGVDLYA